MTESARPRMQRGTIVRFAVAGAAVLGIGAAITTAAWTDQVFFTADASTATFNLQGSDAATGPWDEYATEADALVIPIAASEFGDLVPNGAAKSVTVYVKNDSTVAADLVSDTRLSGDLFSLTGATTTVSAVLDKTTLAADEVTPLTITLTPGDLPASFQGKTGTILVEVTGSTQ